MPLGFGTRRVLPAPSHLCYLHYTQQPLIHTTSHSISPPHYCASLRPPTAFLLHLSRALSARLRPTILANLTRPLVVRGWRLCSALNAGRLLLQGWASVRSRGHAPGIGRRRAYTAHRVKAARLQSLGGWARSQRRQRQHCEGKCK